MRGCSGLPAGAKLNPSCIRHRRLVAKGNPASCRRRALLSPQELFQKSRNFCFWHGFVFPRGKESLEFLTGEELRRAFLYLYEISSCAADLFNTPDVGSHRAGGCSEFLSRILFNRCLTDPRAGRRDPRSSFTLCRSRKPLAHPAGRASMTVLHLPLLLTAVGFWMPQDSSSRLLPNDTESLSPAGGRAAGLLRGAGVPRGHQKRFLSRRDMSMILDYHNQVRAQVSPPAANMEYMVWDERLARAAEAWAARCLWDHGPPELMKYMGQNLFIHSGRSSSVINMVKSWHQEKQHYSFPHPHECNPRCPSKCSGSVCSHYTQMVWASSSRLGCALSTCSNIRVWGSTLRHAVLLVCNYAFKGNWQGEVPYKVGQPCSACPPTYGGGCSNNMCFTGLKSNHVS